MSKGMNIVLVTSYFPPETKGGAEISTLLIAQALQERGHNIKVVTEGVEGEAVVEGIKVIKVPAGLRQKPLNERRKSKKVAAVLASKRELLNGADIIHANDFRAVLGLIEWQHKEKSQVPIVATVRDYASCSGSTNFITATGDLPTDSIQDAWLSHRTMEVRGPRRWARWWQYRANINYRKEVFNELDGEIYISNKQAKLIRQHRTTNVPMTVIYNPLADDYLDSKISTGYAGNVLYVGTVENYKGVGLLLESWKTVIKKAPHATLKIVGDGRNKSEYESMTERESLQYSVQFVGKLPWNQIIREYDKAQVVVAPHIWFEPFGRTVAEGMARGKLVVAADAGGPAEMLAQGRIGVLFQRKSVTDLARALVQSINMNDEDRKRRGKEAREWARNHLGKNRIASLYEEFYKEIIATKRK